MLSAAARQPVSLSTMQEVPQYPGNRKRKCLIADPEIESEKKSGDQHHHRCAVDFLFVRPSHALHLRPNVGDIFSNLDPSALLNTDLLAHDFLCLPTTQRFMPGTLAGAEGFEPP